MAILLFLISTCKDFDMGKSLFEVIIHNVEHENTYGILPLPSLIYEVLMLQKNILGEDEMLEPIIPPPLKVSQKLYACKHAPNVQKSAAVSRTVPGRVTTCTETNSKLVQFLSSDLL